VQAGTATVEADEIAYDTAARVVTARGRARVTHPRFRLFADLLTFDLDRQVITAEGRVRVVESGGREVRGRRVVYDVTRRTGVISGAETIVDRLYVRGETIHVSPERLVVEEAMATPCDPLSPLYRVTARRIEVIPGDVAVVQDATLWLGSIRVLRLGQYRISLRPAGGPGERRTPGFGIVPGAGYNQTDGFWVNLRYPYRLGSVGGELYTKYGQYTGLFALNTLQYERPGWSLTFRAGRTQNAEPVTGILRAFSQAEVIGTLTPRSLAGTPLRLSGALAAGWFHETDTAISTTRLDGTITLATEALRLGPRLRAFVSASTRYSVYGTGHQRAVLTIAAALSYQLDESTSLALRHDLLAQWGATPFLFDAVTPASTASITLSRRVGDYRLQAGAAHNFLVPETKLTAGVGMRLSPTLFLDIDAVYNLRVKAFEDIDYLVTFGCDCATISVGYRQVRGEFSIQMALTLSDRVTFTQPAP
jgi:hypothetical protein